MNPTSEDTVNFDALDTAAVASAVNLNNVKAVLKVKADMVLEYLQLIEGNKEAIKEILTEVDDMGVDKGIFRKACMILFKDSLKEETEKAQKVADIVNALQTKV